MRLIFGFSKPKSEAILSTLIRKIEKREFSHAYIRLVEPAGNEVIFQASGLSVNLLLASKFDEIEDIIEEYELILPNPDIWSYILSKLGTPYSIVQLFRIFIYKISGIKIGRDGVSREICSELVARLCFDMGISIPGDLDYTTPSDLQKFCAATMKRVR